MPPRRRASTVHIPPFEGDGTIIDTDIVDEIESSYLEYSYSVIYSRALPDARDGLKPVHRRILYSMADSGLRPDRGHVKSARVVGDVMGRFHPHGDSAIYDALVRLAQPFSMRVPLVDGHGNFGSPDDPPAAARYTEARMTAAALLLTEGLGEETVDFEPNYDGSEIQPSVLPAAYPNLLVNGTSGIAVGMATNMIPHNLVEVVDAAQHLLEHPEASLADLMRHVPGPDLPTGGQLEQADGTAWMAFYCSTMLAMALELAEDDPEYEDIASKFFEHFVAIADAMNSLGGTGLWHEEDGFYYDQLLIDGQTFPLRLRSAVGIIPLFAVEFIDETRLDRLPGFAKRTRWFLKNRKDLSAHISYLTPGKSGSGLRLLAIPSKERLQRVLRYVFDEKEFLSPYGVRSLSRIYQEKPFVLQAGGQEYRVDYVPGESDSGLFGGNSNWRGPVWFPTNYLLIEALERYHHFYGDSFTVEFPTGSGRQVTLQVAAEELSKRLVKLFLPGADGERACHGPEGSKAEVDRLNELVLFHEYFHGESGQGLGASHQTGWTALVARLIEGISSKKG